MTDARAACAHCGEIVEFCSWLDEPDTRKPPKCLARATGTRAAPDRIEQMAVILQRFYDLGYNECAADHDPISVSRIEAAEALDALESGRE